jgi:hypothetical protein
VRSLLRAGKEAPTDNPTAKTRCVGCFQAHESLVGWAALTHKMCRGVLQAVVKIPFVDTDTLAKNALLLELELTEAEVVGAKSLVCYSSHQLTVMCFPTFITIIGLLFQMHCCCSVVCSNAEISGIILYCLISLSAHRQ